MAFKLYVLLGSFVLLCCYSGVDAGDCINIWSKSDNALDKAINKIADHCPLIGLGSAEWCCYNFKLEPHCCETQEFIINMVIAAIIIIVLLSVISFVCSCFCCKCR